jgi:hypothetical protein
MIDLCYLLHWQHRVLQVIAHIKELSWFHQIQLRHERWLHLIRLKLLNIKTLEPWVSQHLHCVTLSSQSHSPVLLKQELNYFD